ncbi:MAG: TonB-dependent receptor [Alphaproteobacteria bacterium]
MKIKLSLLLVLLPGFAFAQDLETLPTTDQPPSDPIAAQSATTEAPRTLDEVIVTAQHREQALRDVPLSITAVGGEEMRNQGVTTLDGVARLTPNVFITSERVFMRGFGSANNQTLESSVGFSIDGVAYGRRGYFREGFTDVERFEVLRGPQGTLFGKNAVAGVINIITGDPQDEFGLRAKYAIGNQEQQQIDGAVWGPIWEDVVEGRLAFNHGEAGDFIFNTTIDEMVGFDKIRGGRGKLKFQLTPSFDVLLSLQYGTRWGDTPNGEITALAVEAQALYDAFDPDTDYNLDRRAQRDEFAVTSRSSWTGFMKAGLDIGDWRVESQTGYSVSEDYFNLDGDYGGGPIVVLRTGEDYYQISEEIRLLSPPGRFELTAGLFYFHSRLEGWNSVPVFEFDGGITEILPVLLPALAAGPLADLVGGIANPPFTAEQTDATFDQKTTSYAIYGQARYNFSDALSVELGLRMNYEDKEIVYERITPPPSLVLTVLGVEQFTYIGDRQEFDISPKVSVLYDLSDEVTAYATLARGFKAGGFSTAAIKPSEMIFEPEQSDTLEVGVKGNFFGGLARANLGSYYMKFQDLQVSNYNGTGFVLSNAAAATAMGVEADGMIVPAEWLLINGAVGYNFATYDSYPNGVCPATSPIEGAGAAEGSCDLAGRGLAYAPRWNASLGALVHFPLQIMKAQIFFGAQATYRSNTFLDTDLDPLDAQPANTLVNLRFGLNDDEEVWQAMITVRNATDKLIKLASNDIPLFTGSHAAYANRPRQILASFEVRF